MIHKKKYMAMLLMAGFILQGSFPAFAQTAQTAVLSVNAGGISVPGGPGTENEASPGSDGGQAVSGALAPTVEGSAAVTTSAAPDTQNTAVVSESPAAAPAAAVVSESPAAAPAAAVVSESTVAAPVTGDSGVTAGTVSSPVVGPVAGNTVSSGSTVVTAGSSSGPSAGPGASGSGTVTSGTITAGSGTSGTAAADQSTAWTKVNGVYVDSEGKSMDGVLSRGISVSKWQGDIDWSQVAADDVSFAFIRMGSFGYEGEYTMDEYYEKNMNGAIAAGLRTAPYVFLQTKTVEEAREAAKYAVEQAKGYTVSYPFAVDIEADSILELSVQELTDVVNAFCQEIAAAGYTPIVYSDYNKFSTEMDTSQIPYDLWLARYGVDGQYPNRTIWQSTDQGSVAGIEGNVCLEFAYKDYGSSGSGPSRVITAP